MTMNSPLLSTQLILIFTTFNFLCVNGTTYNFFRDVRPKSYTDGRRIFGGTTASLSDFPQSCLLTENDKGPKCSGSIITLRFVVTAAHCIQPYLRHIFYNSRIPIGIGPLKDGDSVSIARIYRHPKFSYKSADEGYGPDIVQLYHDIGLVKSSSNMYLEVVLPVFRSKKIPLSEVNVLGFGVKDTPGSPELLSVKLHVHPCFRHTWRYCACGVARRGEQSRGVCSGDSGGPVVQEGTLVGVTSMGPASCASMTDTDAITTSVFTLVSNYADMINNTIYNQTEAMAELPLSKSNSLPIPSFSYTTCEYAHISFNIHSWMVTFLVLKIIE